MQNFEIVVDDEETLAEIGLVQSGVSEEFVRENYSQLSFSEEELIQKGTGVLATMFPPSWQKPTPGSKRSPTSSTASWTKPCGPVLS
jgi:hypothetical protein